MKERDLLLQKMAVWQEAHEHLLKFLDSDANPTKLGIRSKGESLTVSQSIITVVRTHIETEIGRLDTEIENINKAEVAEDETKRKNQTAPKAEGTPAKGNPKGKGGGRKPQKPVPAAS
jgi:hypothetical protein